MLVLTIEVNAVGLHIRQLLRMYDVSRSSLKYKLSTAVYILSFVYKVLAIVTSMVFCYGDFERMSMFWNTALLLMGATLLVINLVLFQKFLTTQFLC